MKFSFLLRGQKGESMHLDAGLSYFVLSSLSVESTKKAKSLRSQRLCGGFFICLTGIFYNARSTKRGNKD